MERAPAETVRLVDSHRDRGLAITLCRFRGQVEAMHGQTKLQLQVSKYCPSMLQPAITNLPCQKLEFKLVTCCVQLRNVIPSGQCVSSIVLPLLMRRCAPLQSSFCIPSPGAVYGGSLYAQSVVAGLETGTPATLLALSTGGRCKGSSWRKLQLSPAHVRLRTLTMVAGSSQFSTSQPNWRQRRRSAIGDECAISMLVQGTLAVCARRGASVIRHLEE
jgi:hypothetical protein